MCRKVQHAMPAGVRLNTASFAAGPVNDTADSSGSGAARRLALPLTGWIPDARDLFALQQRGAGSASNRIDWKLLQIGRDPRKTLYPSYFRAQVSPWITGGSQRCKQSPVVKVGIAQ